MSRNKLAVAAVAGTLALSAVAPAPTAFAQEEESFSSRSSEMTSSERNDEILTAIGGLGVLFVLGLIATAMQDAGLDPEALVWALAFA